MKTPVRLAIGLCFAAAFAGAASSAPVASSPETAQAAICRPIFRVSGRDLGAGTAFLLDAGRPDGRIFLVSAQHLFGPAGGLEADIAWSDMPSKVSAAACMALQTPALWQTGPAMAIPGAHAMDQTALKDIAAFPIDPRKLPGKPSPLRLAAEAPKVGDTVWLVAELVGGAPRGQRLHRATVTYAGADATEYRYDNAALQIRATSGAPMVNARGEVVGVNLGGGEYKGAMVGVADPLATVRKALIEARDH